MVYAVLKRAVELREGMATVMVKGSCIEGFAS
jgi:hypothetical protein